MFIKVQFRTYIELHVHTARTAGNENPSAHAKVRRRDEPILRCKGAEPPILVSPLL